MYCKLEGGFGNYVSYADVDRRHLSKIVEIKLNSQELTMFNRSVEAVKKLIEEICHLVPGPVSAEVVSLEAEGMFKEGLELSKIAKKRRC